MARKIRKSLAFLLALIMVMSCLGIGALADGDTSTHEEQQPGTEVTGPVSGGGLDAEEEKSESEEPNEPEEEKSEGEEPSEPEEEKTEGEEPGDVTEGPGDEGTDATAPVLTQQTIQAAAAGTLLTISGMLPEGAYAIAGPVYLELEGVEVLAAYDISLYFADGQEYQPVAYGQTVTVNIAVDALADYDSVEIYHLENTNAVPELVDTVATPGNTATFDAESFSIYVVGSSQGNNSYNRYELAKGESVQLVLNRSDASNVSWSITSGSSRANVNSSGLVRAISEGDVTVRATGKTYKGGSFEDFFYIKITNGSDLTSKGTADHIDIGVKLNASVVVDGTTYTQDVTMTRADLTSDRVTISAAVGGKAFTDFNYDLGDISTSSGGTTGSQYRIGGSYPVGTKDNPVVYTVTLKKDVTFTVDGKAIEMPLTFSASFSYWQSDNDCPPLRNSSTWKNGGFVRGSGLDFLLGAGSGVTSTKGEVSVQKTVSGADLTGNKSYIFDIYTSQNVWVDEIVVEVGAHELGLGSKELEYGDYYIVERESGLAIDGYTYAGTTVQVGDQPAASSLTGSFIISQDSKTASVHFTNSYTTPTS